MSWQEKKAAKDELGRVFQLAYDSKGWPRLVIFARLSCTGARYGMFSWPDAFKLMVVGCWQNRSVTFGKE